MAGKLTFININKRDIAMELRAEENKDIPEFKISVAANKLGISVHTLRMYEREGLIIPFKKNTKQRLYSENDLERLRCIRTAINEDKISIEGIKRIYSLIPCYAIVNCSASDKENCAAVKEHTQPCWTYKHRNNYCTDRDCRSCVVYNSFSNCDIIKRKILELIT